MTQRSTTQKTIVMFWHHATRYPKLLVPLLIFVPINLLIGDFLSPYIISQVLQKISQKAYDAHHLWHSFGAEILLYSLAVAISGILGWRVIVWLIWNLEIRVVRDMSQRIFDHLLVMSADFHANRFGGSLVSQANKLTGAYVRFTDATIFNLYTLVIAILATIAILAPRVPVYAVVLVILSATYIIGTLFFSKPVRDANIEEAEAQSRQTGYLADSITNIMAIKSFARGNHEQKRYWKAATRTLLNGKRSMTTTTRRELYASTITSSIGIAAVVIAVIGVGVLHANIATIFLMVNYTGNIGARLWDFQNVLRQYNRAVGDSTEMIAILEIEPDIKDPVEPEEPAMSKGAIDFNNVSFTHAGSDKNDALFDQLDLHIKPGEKIGLIGHSGSGKTTFTRLLLRFSDIDDGEILIDGQNIAHVTQDDLRKNISYVPQEPLLFHRSLTENIAYGKLDATAAEVALAAKKAYAADFIDKLPQKYETLVGERGVKLSGGQRQRIAIARAILKDSPILVLDEATSALDSESERLIQAALATLMQDRTAIVIAHRLSTIQRMDRIVVLEEGRIAEQGSHKELLAEKGVYAKLWAHQSGGFLED